jgi:hypothetical protein
MTMMMMMMMMMTRCQSDCEWNCEHDDWCWSEQVDSKAPMTNWMQQIACEHSEKT